MNYTSTPALRSSGHFHQVCLLLLFCGLARMLSNVTGIWLCFRGTLDLNLKHAAMEKKTQHDLHARKLREKERDLK